MPKEDEASENGDNRLDLPKHRVAQGGACAKHQEPCDAGSGARACSSGSHSAPRYHCRPSHRSPLDLATCRSSPTVGYHAERSSFAAHC